MHELLIYAMCGLVSYLLGAIPFGYVVARAKGVDIQRVGSGNIGATNVFRTVGKGWGILTFLCDALKGFVPVFFLPRIALTPGATDGPDSLKILCVVLAVVGHNWPVYLRFKGGKGVATSTGALLGMAPLGLVIGLGVWVLVFVTGRFVSLASLAAAIAIASSAWWLYEGLPIPVTLTLLCVLTIWRHRGNIKRLVAGTESRLELGRKKPASSSEASQPAGGIRQP